MTKAEILALPPGPELDAIVAARIFLQPKPTRYADGAAWWSRSSRESDWYAWNFSGHIEYGWLVVEKMRADGWRFMLDDESEQCPEQPWLACFLRSEKIANPGNEWSEDTCGQAAIVPHAICRAALSARLE